MAPKRQPIKHGTLYAYKARGCRCKKCRRANADACRDYSRSRGTPAIGHVCKTSDGRRFRTQTEAAAALGVNKGTVSYHLNRYGNLDRIGNTPGGRAPRRCKPIQVGTRTWESNAALERYLRVRPGRVYDWLRRGDMDRLIAALMRADAAAAAARMAAE